MLRSFVFKIFSVALCFLSWLLLAACTAKKPDTKVGDCIGRVDSVDILQVTRIEGDQRWVKNISKNEESETLAPVEHIVSVPCPSGERN